MYIPSTEWYVKCMYHRKLLLNVVVTKFILHDFGMLYQACYGGHGYTHILENVVPKLEQRGIKKDIITKIITQNPQTWLTFSTCM